jgi:hypothetical protein
MQIKKIIIVIVMIIALVGGGYFAYQYWGKTALTPTEKVVSTRVILPHGTNLNFNKVNKFNETGRTFTYPKVDPLEAGLPLDAIISQ